MTQPIIVCTLPRHERHTALLAALAAADLPRTDLWRISE